MTFNLTGKNDETLFANQHKQQRRCCCQPDRRSGSFVCLIAAKSKRKKRRQTGPPVWRFFVTLNAVPAVKFDVLCRT
jgi:hypothetical protein